MAFEQGGSPDPFRIDETVPLLQGLFSDEMIHDLLTMSGLGDLSQLQVGKGILNNHGWGEETPTMEELVRLGCINDIPEVLHAEILRSDIVGRFQWGRNLGPTLATRHLFGVSEKASNGQLQRQYALVHFNLTMPSMDFSPVPDRIRAIEPRIMSAVTVKPNLFIDSLGLYNGNGPFRSLPENIMVTYPSDLD